NIYKRGQEATKRNKIPDTGGLKRGQDRKEGPIILPVSPETSCDKYENGNYVRAWCFTWNLGRSRSAVALMEVTLGSDKLQKFGAASSLYAQSLDHRISSGTRSCQTNPLSSVEPSPSRFHVKHKK